MQKPLKNIKKGILSHRTIYCSLFVVILISLFLRLYKLHEFLGFWYDQGRDGLVIWRLFNEGKFFLIGPVTGIEGIFLGPFYYYLIAPFYWLGQGSPVFVIAALNWLGVLGLLILYLLGKECFSRQAGLLAVLIYGFSYPAVFFSRWLANPQPLPFFSLLTLFFLLKIYKGQEKYWPLVGLLTGLSLQIEAAGAIFFLPAVIGITFWQRKKIKRWNLIGLGAVLFSATLLPQIFFNFRHDGILFAAFKRFLVAEKAFQVSLWQVLTSRLLTYYDIFLGNFFPNWGRGQIISATLFLGPLAWARKRVFGGAKNILWWWLLTPLVGFLFYQGNFGYIWNYYFAGVIPVFILIFGACLWFLFKQGLLGKVIVFVFLACFLWINGQILAVYYKTGVGVTLGNQLRLINWIYEDSRGQNFNVDVYVPPVIPYAYDYLFKWYGQEKYGYQPVEKRIDLLYTLYEQDSQHPSLLQAWLARQEGIGKIIREDSYGDITVQRRKRKMKNDIPKTKNTNLKM